MPQLKSMKIVLKLLVGLATAGSACTPAFSQDGELHLPMAIEKALTQHPSLVAAASRITGAEGLQKQAGLRPNPTAVIQAENWRFTGSPSFSASRDLDVFAFVTQAIERGHKRERRSSAAEKELAVVRLEKDALHWKIRQEVRLAFQRVLMAQAELGLLEENGRYFDQIVGFARARVENGAMAEADLIKLQIERERLTSQEYSAAGLLDRAKIALLQSMGATDFRTSFLCVEPAPSTGTKAPVGAERLLEIALSQRAELRLAETAIERARAELELERAVAKPDWSFSFGYKRTAGFDTLLAGISLPLPIFDRNEGRLLFRRAELERAEATLRTSRAQVEAEVASALAAVRRRKSILAQMETGLRDRAEESLRIAIAVFQEGGSDVLRLLDAQRVRDEVRLTYGRTQMEYRLDLLALEAAVGEEDLNLSEEALRVQP